MDPLRTRFQSWLDDEARVPDGELERLNGRLAPRLRRPLLALSLSLTTAGVALLVWMHRPGPRAASIDTMQISLRVAGEPESQAMELMIAVSHPEISR